MKKWGNEGRQGEVWRRKRGGSVGGVFSNEGRWVEKRGTV